MADQQQNQGPTLDQYMRSMQGRSAAKPDSRSDNIPTGARDWINRMSASNYRVKHPPRNDQRKPNRK